MIDFENSIVMIGAVGAGKSLMSRALHEKTGMPVITTDILKRCPKTIEEIEDRAEREQQDIQHLEKEIANCRDPQEIAHLKDIINCKRNELWVLGEQKTLREKMPNLPNYFDYGYNGDVANYLQRNFGDIAWHYYQKQFEQLMLEDLCTHYNGAAILDLGGGMPISLDRDYAILHNQFTEIDANLYAQHFTHLDKVGFDDVKNIISRFQHVNYLKLPEDFSQHGNRAMHDSLNPIFLSTHQFDELATDIIDVSHLFEDGQLNRDELNRLTNTIINSATHSLAD